MACECSGPVEQAIATVATTLDGLEEIQFSVASHETCARAVDQWKDLPSLRRVSFAFMAPADEDELLEALTAVENERLEVGLRLSATHSRHFIRDATKRLPALRDSAGWDWASFDPSVYLGW